MPLQEYNLKWSKFAYMVFVIRYLLFSLLIAMRCGSLCIAAEFRDAEWGIPREQVKSLEKTESIYPSKDTLTFKGKVTGRPVDIIYEFKNDKLKGGKYIFTVKNINNNVYIQDYDKINEFLDLKYGQPETRKSSWSNDLYKENKGFYGLAVSLGYLVLESTWNNEKTTIIHTLSGTNNTIEHSISYFDKFSRDDKPEKLESEEMRGL